MTVQQHVDYPVLITEGGEVAVSGQCMLAASGLIMLAADTPASGLHSLVG